MSLYYNITAIFFLILSFIYIIETILLNFKKNFFNKVITVWLT